MAMNDPIRIVAESTGLEAQPGIRSGNRPITSSIIRLFIGPSPKLRRLVLYWASTCSIYFLAAIVLGILDLAGEISTPIAIRFTLVLAVGVGFFYLLVRLSVQLRLEPPTLTILQGIFATIAIVESYAISGRFRGATLSILVVMMSFCGFALSVRQSIALSALGVVTLGGAMIWLVHVDPQGHPPLIELAHFVLACGMLCAVVFLTAEWNRLRDRLKRQKLELANAVEKIQLLATNDELTRLPNRRHMNTVLQQEERRSDRSLRNVCLALIDIDHFKRINDAYGHAIGDEALQIFASHFKRALRTGDVLARWGGEEFLLLLPHTTEETALHVLERIQAQLGSINVATGDENVLITFSGGITTVRPDERIADAVKRADVAMFQAKSEGRNTIRSYVSESDDKHDVLYSS